jgi:hypothetical protein
MRSNLEVKEDAVKGASISSDLPFQILDTDLLACLFVVVKPLTLSQVNSCKFTAGLGTSRKPLPL